MYSTQVITSQLPAQLVEACLNAVNFGVLLVDASSNLFFVNGVATDIIRRCSETGSVLQADCIDAIKAPVLRQRLKEVIAQARKGPTSSQYSNSYLEIDLIACKAQDAGVVVFLRDRTIESSDQFSRRIRKVYELTTREAQIAYELAIGNAVYAIAEHLGVQTNTVRMHLKRIYEKTGTHSQSQLVSRLVPSVFLTNVL